MIRSMTGFGSAVRELGKGRVTAEVRSVNHRFLKVAVKLPRTLATLEPDLESLVRLSVRRGNVNVLVRTEGGSARHAGRIDLEVARAYHEAARQLRRELALSEPAGNDPMPWLVALPGVILAEDDEETVSPELREQVAGAVSGALAVLVQERETEGANLGHGLAQRLAFVRSCLATLGERAPAVPKALRDRLLERVQALLVEARPAAPVSDPDLLREICLLADRADITEELDRLQSHVTRAERFLAEGGEIGRGLDFLLQEMLREANTIGSKANDTEVAHLVIDLKGEIERMKEQVQNLE